MKHIILVLTCLIFTGCPWDTRLVLVNNTSKRIHYREETKAPDDSIPDLTKCETAKPYPVLHDTEEVIWSPNQWDVYFRNHPDHLLRIFIMDDDSLSKYGACKVFRQKIFL